jgi:chaperonin GroES
MSNIIPLGDYVLVETIEEETLNAGGVFLMDSGKDKPGLGKVLAIWPGKIGETGVVIPIKDIEVGDIVFFAKYSPEEIEIDEKKLTLVKYASIFAKKTS